MCQELTFDVWLGSLATTLAGQSGRAQTLGSESVLSGEPLKTNSREAAMKTCRFEIVVVVACLAATLSCRSAHADEVVTLKATSGRLLHAGLYPSYFVFLKGLDPTAKTAWVNKPYKAVLDIEAGPEKGQSVVIDLVPTTQASPNPEWCDTEGGENFSGGGVTCRPESTSKEQLRYRVRVLRSDDLPKTFAGRTIAEYPNLPGRRENETLGPFEMRILLQE
jgi:hypothetical protein